MNCLFVVLCILYLKMKKIFLCEESVFRHNKKKLPSALPASLFNVLIMTYFNLFQKSSICRIEQLARLFFPLKYHKPITDINQILISIRSVQSNKRWILL